MTTAAIILAGGASTRMGSPKALLTYEGETFVDRLIRIFNLLCKEVIVVTGRDEIQSGSARFIVNEAWQQGQLSSLQCGLRNLTSSPDAILFTPVDCPTFDPRTPAALVERFDGDAPLVRPRFNGRRGHPVLFHAALIQEFLTLGPDASAREVVHRYANQTRYVDVDDPGILRDIDDPSDYEALAGARA